MGLSTLAAGCLPTLDTSKLEPSDASTDSAEAASQSGCVGGAPDGWLQSGEQCDDNNRVENDGCSSGCQLVCEGFLDSVTGSCYFLAKEQTPAQATAPFFPCPSGTHALTLSGTDEWERLQGWLSSTSAQVVWLGLLAADDYSTWYSVQSEEPGWSSQKLCPGCYSNWDISQGEPQNVGRLRRFAVLDRQAGWKWRVSSIASEASLVCERELPARPENQCRPPGCDPTQVTEYSFGQRTYHIVSAPMSISDARAECRNWAGQLVVLDGNKRQELVRWGPASDFWLGLHKEPSAGTWIWMDGKTESERPVPWSSSELKPVHVWAALEKKAGFDTNLVRGAAVNEKLAVVCEKP